MKLVCLAITLAIVSFTNVRGHGMLWDPPMRGSLNRFGYNIGVTDWKESSHICGYFKFDEYVGCNACGEPILECPSGELCKNIIVKTYKAGTTIPVLMNIEANHGGVMQFRLCPSSNGAVTWDCLEKNRLKIVEAVDQGEISNGGTIYQQPGELDETGHIKQHGKMTLHVQLPYIKCERCVFQWHWTAGDEFGTCTNGTVGFGCGPQQTYINCADIKLE